MKEEITKRNVRIWSMLGMRRVIGNYINELAENDETFVFATADVGRYFGVQEYQKNFAERYIDVGIAEQNLVTVAAGMAKEGCNVFAATYATFITARVLDQIRVNMGYMCLPVKLIGVGGGLSEGDLSPTHMGLEDIADILAIPNIVLVCPADAVEAVKAMEALSNLDKPSYLRLTGKTNLPMIYKEEYEFQIGKSICLKDGKDVVIIATGCIVGNVLKAADMLEQSGISCRVVDMHTIRPIDIGELKRDSASDLIVTVEEHMVTGGLGSAVSDYYCDKLERPYVYKIGIENEYPIASEYEILLKRLRLDSEGIAERVKIKYNEIKEVKNANIR